MMFCAVSEKLPSCVFIWLFLTQKIAHCKLIGNKAAGARNFRALYDQLPLQNIVKPKQHLVESLRMSLHAR